MGVGGTEICFEEGETDRQTDRNRARERERQAAHNTIYH